MTYTLEINHERRDVNAPAGTSLLTVLRDDMRLTGAKFGCGHGQCGACVVLVDGEPVPACTVPIEEIGERSVVTIEGLATGERLHPVQRAFLDEGAIQCGYCTSGMILAAVALLERASSPKNVEIRDALAPHLCRCGVYQRAIRAVQRAAHEARQ
jgi:nicotinate dehydrogenase subunit A